MSNLIIVKQLPIIEEQLRSLKAEIEAKVAAAKSLVCTADTVKDIKKVRSELNAQFAELEAERKAVKASIMAPYDAFEAVYKECVSGPFKSCDESLASEIRSVEGQLKAEKEEKVKAYFDEYAESLHIQWLSYFCANINVTLSASEKSLREAAKQFVDKVNDDITLIDTMEYADEILVDYKKSLNLASATAGVRNRKAALQREQEAKAKTEFIRASENVAAAKVGSFAPPVAVESFAPPVEVEELPTAPIPAEDDPVKVLSFKVKAPVSKLRELKKFMEDNGYEYQ